MGMMKWIYTPRPYRTYRHSVVFILIEITVAMFLLQRIVPALRQYLFLNPFFVFRKGFVWTLVTYMFAHANFSHILFNMLGLFFFGMPLERTWGSDEFLVLYLATGILSGVISLVFYIIFGAWGVFLLGASGAVFGVMLAFTCLYPHAQIYIFGIFPVTARILMLVYIALQLFSLSGGINSGVAYLTHLSGIGVAWVYMLARHSVNPYKRLFNQ